MESPTEGGRVETVGGGKGNPFFEKKEARPLRGVPFPTPPSLPQKTLMLDMGGCACAQADFSALREAVRKKQVCLKVSRPSRRTCRVMGVPSRLPRPRRMARMNKSFLKGEGESERKGGTCLQTSSPPSSRYFSFSLFSRPSYPAFEVAMIYTSWGSRMRMTLPSPMMVAPEIPLMSPR